MKTNTSWYLAAESKKGRTIHLAGHFRLGDGFAKCGKTLGRKVAAYNAAFMNPCGTCAIEQNKEIEREKKRVSMENPTPSWVPQDHTPAERAAKIQLIKTLAADLAEKANFGATLESIVVHASALLKDEAIRTGRGFKGPKGGC